MKKITSILFTLAFLFISFNSLTNNNGPGGGYTNAPGEDNCTNSSCHGGTLNSGGSLSNLKLDHNFTGGGYIPDSTYTIKVQMSQSSISKWGFNITALRASNNDPAGDFTITSNRTQKRTKSVSGKTRNYVEHTSSGTSSTSTNATEWEFKWTAPSTNVGDIKFYVALNAANGNGGSSGDQIYGKVFTHSPSTSLPVAKASTNDTIICAGAVAKFKGGGTNSPTTYSWLFPNGNPSISSDSTPSVNFNFPGTQKAILRVKNSKGWSGYDTISITVLQAPTAFIGGGDTRKICKGDSITLTAQAGTGYSFLWSNGKTSRSIVVKDTGSYHVFVTLGTCEKISNIVKVENFANTKVAISTSAVLDSLCQGDVLKLSTSPGFDTFYWYNNYVLIAKTDTNFYNLNLDSVAKFNVKVRDQNGCIGSFSDTASYTVIAKEPAPTVTCKNQTPFSVDFDWTGLQSHGGAQISTNKGGIWSTPSSGSSGNKHSLSGLNPEQNYEVWVRGVMSAPCFYTEVTKAVCKTGKCSPLEASVKADSLVCDGDVLKVEVNGLSKENYSLSFEGGQAFTDTIFSFTPLLNKTYTIEVLDSAFPACPSKKLTFPVKIDKIDLLQFKTQRPNHTFCQGDTIQFSASSGNDDYAFYVNNTLRTTTSDSFYYESQFKDGDSAYVKVQKGACKETSETIYLNVVPTPSATFTYNRVGSVYDFTPTNKNYQTYFWNFGDGFTSVLKEPQHDYKASSKQTMNVKLDIKDNNECVSSSNQNIEIPDFSSIQRLAGGSINIYPSPAGNSLHVDWLSEISYPSTISIFDLNGVEVLHVSSKDRLITLDLSPLPAGAYVLRLSSDQGVLVHRLIKQ